MPTPSTHHSDNRCWVIPSCPDASGLFLLNPSHTHFLLLLRSGESDFPHTWCTPGGGWKEGDCSSLATAVREFEEECGSVPFFSVLTSIDHPTNGFTTHVVEGPGTFWDPTLNSEHVDWKWFSFCCLPPNLHPGTRYVVDFLQSYPHLVERSVLPRKSGKTRKNSAKDGSNQVKLSTVEPVWPAEHFLAELDSRHPGSFYPLSWQWRGKMGNGKVQVELHAHDVKTDEVTIDLIKSFDREKGYGTKVLRELTILADRLKVTLTLFADSLGAMTTSELKRWYKTFGFRTIGGDFMRRKPR